MRVYRLLRERILSGGIRPEGKLRPEHQMAKEFGLSVITVRHALKMLQEQGLIERTAGRGTFVRLTRAPKFTLMASDFLGSIRKAAPDMTRRLLKREIVAPPTEVSEALGLLRGEQCLLAERADILHGEPLAYDQAYIPLPLAGEIDDLFLERMDFLDLWLKRSGLAASCVSESIEAAGADEEMSRKLRVDIGTPVLVSRETISDAVGAGLIYFVSYYRGDCFRRVSTTQRAMP
ncbi:MAG: GntR family transcriptional regulator [Planctomycetota bacterium]